MKKILILSLTYFPKHVGGAEIAIKEITNRVDPHDIAFHMVTLRFDSTLPKREQAGNVLVHRIGFTKHSPSMNDLKSFPLHLNKFLFQITAMFKTLRLHRRYHYDAIWGMMAHATGAPLTLFNLVYPKVPTILTLQEGDPLEYIKRKARPIWPLFKRVFTHATIIQTISTFLAQFAVDMGYRGQPVVIPNAVDTKHFSQRYSENELARVRAKIGKKPDDVFLITTSRLVHKNAVDDVIRALPLLPENIHFLVLGKGPDEVILKGLTREMDVEKRTHFFGHVEHKEMPKYLKACDIFIRPSRSEGMGNSFVEAMAAGIPVIATQEGGIADFLFDPERNSDKVSTGRAVDANNPRDIASAVIKYLENKEATGRIMRNAKKMALKKYDWNVIAKNMKENVFDQVL